MALISDECLIADALPEGGSITKNIAWRVPTGAGGTHFERKWSNCGLRQLAT
jgi:hypothetical protein